MMITRRAVGSLALVMSCWLTASAAHAYTWSASRLDWRNFSVSAIDVGYGKPVLTWTDGTLGSSAETTIHRQVGDPVSTQIADSDWHTSNFSLLSAPSPFTYDFDNTVAIASYGHEFISVEAISQPICCAASPDLNFAQGSAKRFGDFTISGRGAIVFKIPYYGFVLSNDVGGVGHTAARLGASYSDAGGSSTGMVQRLESQDTPGSEDTLILTIVSNAGGGTGSFYAEISAYSAAPIAAVPEPQTYAMLLAGLGLVSLRIHRRRAT
jgi:PEP-CTERM motif